MLDRVTDFLMSFAMFIIAAFFAIGLSLALIFAIVWLITKVV